jgi:hypothetical protein
MPKTSCAGAPDAVAYPPPRRHSPATRASRACRDGATSRATTSNAARCSHRTRRAASRVGLDAPHGHHAWSGGASLRRPLRGSWDFPGATLALLAWCLGRWRSKLRARSARRRRVPARGGGSRHRARQRTMSCDQTGGTQSPPSQNRRQSGRPRISTGGRTAGHLHRPQNGRAAQPAAELPGISTGRRTAARLTRRQNCRASPPAAERPRGSLGGRTAGHLHRPQNGRAAHPAADRPSHAPGRRSAVPLTRRQIGPSIPAGAEPPAPATPAEPHNAPLCTSGSSTRAGAVCGTSREGQAPRWS